MCRHCGHEYEEENFTSGWDEFLSWITVIGIFILAIYILITLCSWLMFDESLVDTIKGQWEWIKSKRIF